MNGSGTNSGRRLLASDSNYNVYSGASDNKTALQSQPSSDMQENNSSDAPSNNTGSGQYMRVCLYPIHDSICLACSDASDYIFN